MTSLSNDGDGISLDAESVPPGEAELFDFFSPADGSEETDSFLTGSVVTDKSKKSRLTSGGPGTSLRKPTGKADDDAARSTPPRADEWQDFWSRTILRLGTDFYIDRAFSDIDEDWLSEREIRRIRLAPDERDRIAKPLAELSNKLKFTRKHGRTIIATAGSIDSLIQLGMWMNRVNRIARKYRLQTNRPTQRRQAPRVFMRSQVQTVEPENVTPTQEGREPGNVSSQPSSQAGFADGQQFSNGEFVRPDHWRPDIEGDFIIPGDG